MAFDLGITEVSSLGRVSTIGQVSGRDARVDFFAPASDAERAKTSAARQAESRAIRQREEDQRREEERQQVTEQNEQDLEDSLARLNDTFGERNFDAQFAIDSGLNRVIVQVLDKESHDLIRQVPLEGLLDLSRRAEGSRGLLLNEYV